MMLAANTDRTFAEIFRTQGWGRFQQGVVVSLWRLKNQQKNEKAWF